MALYHAVITCIYWFKNWKDDDQANLSLHLEKWGNKYQFSTTHLTTLMNHMQDSKYWVARLPGATKNLIGQVEIVTSLPDGQVVNLGPPKRSEKK